MAILHPLVLELKSHCQGDTVVVDLAVRTAVRIGRLSIGKKALDPETRDSSMAASYCCSLDVIASRKERETSCINDRSVYVGFL